jgi:hypothetical protein
MPSADAGESTQDNFPCYARTAYGHRPKRYCGIAGLRRVEQGPHDCLVRGGEQWQRALSAERSENVGGSGVAIRAMSVLVQATSIPSDRRRGTVNPPYRMKSASPRLPLGARVAKTYAAFRAAG